MENYLRQEVLQRSWQMPRTLSLFRSRTQCYTVGVGLSTLLTALSKWADLRESTLEASNGHAKGSGTTSEKQLSKPNTLFKGRTPLV